MKKRRKSKLKIKNIVILSVIVIGIIFLIIKLFSKNPFKVELNENIIDYGSEYQADFKAMFKDDDITDKVKVAHKIDTKKLGKYEITFIYKNEKKEYEVVKNIEVKDISKPTITLTRGEEITVVINGKYKEPGFEVTDNYDIDLNDKVKISGEVDTSKEGTYEIKYTARDSSKNETTVIRKVIVTKNSPLNQSVKDFSLEGMFTDVLLQETKAGGKTYSDEFIFAGDSTALYYVINKQITGKRLWHKEGINPETALTNSIYINHTETSKTFIENFKDKKPAKVIMTLGTNSAAYMEPTYFIKNYKKLIEGIKEVSPNTLIIIQAIPPVASYYDSKTTGINNDKINKLNYYILEMCSELNIPFLNSAEALKDENGALKDGYSIKDGIHLSKTGNEVLMKYFENHMYEG